MTEAQVKLVSSIIRSLHIAVTDSSEEGEDYRNVAIECAISSLELLIRGEPLDDTNY